MDFFDFLKSKLSTIALVLAFGAVAFVTVELYMQKRQVDSEISRLENQSNTLKKGNQQLSELIKYLDTEEYKEREAREKLNLKRPGEQVVVLPEDSSSGQVASIQTDNQPNPQKWFTYFFNSQ